MILPGEMGWYVPKCGKGRDGEVSGVLRSGSGGSIRG